MVADKETFLKERLDEIAKLKARIKELEKIVKSLGEVRARL